MDRVILHCDCNSFFASVELVDLPHLRHLPVAVCGSEQERHGIVLAKNEIAKRYGIYTTQTVLDARRKCPELVIIPPHYEKYAAYSKAVREIFERYTDQIEPFGMDEAWLDVTASQKLFGSGEEIAQRIREQIKAELSITVSIGVSFNKVFAKLGSDYKKPDAVTVISRENFERIVHPLPVSSLLYAGKQTCCVLETMHIKTIGDLAKAPLSRLSTRLGKMGRMLYAFANGDDTSPVCAEREDPKSISNGRTFPRDLLGFAEFEGAIRSLCEEVGSTLRRRRMKCTTVFLKMKDNLLHTYGKQATLPSATNSTDEIVRRITELLPQLWKETTPARTITVGVGGLLLNEYATEQIDMFADPEEEKMKQKNTKREDVVDSIRERFGHGAIYIPSDFD